MSLDYNLTKIKDYMTVCYEIDTNPEADGFEGLISRTRFTEDGVQYVMKWTTHLLIFATMSLGLGTITAANVDKVWCRMYTYERMFGAFRLKRTEDGKQEPHYYTYDEIVQHIGLITNVSAETDMAWNRHMMGILQRDALTIAKNHRLATKEG